MILYSLLLTHKKKDITNIILTALIMYILLYIAIPKRYGLAIIACISLVDTYMSWSHIQRPATRTRRRSRPRHRRVHFAPQPEIMWVPPVQQTTEQNYIDEHSPEYRFYMLEAEKRKAEIASVPQIQPQYVEPFTTAPTRRPQTPESESESESSEISYSSEEL